jgi:DNA transformation protein and related proteins
LHQCLCIFYDSCTLGVLRYNQHMKDTSYRDYIVEDVMGHIPGVTARGMFSGYGLYLDGVIFGLIIDGELYLKADMETVEKYKLQGLYPFTYEKKNGKVYEMAYMSVSLDELEDRDRIQDRVMESYYISLKAKSK